MIESTVPELAASRGPAEAERALGLLVIECTLQPDRVGAWLPVQRGKWILGRGNARATDGYPRLQIFKQRPGANLPLGSLESAALSRVQALVSAEKPNQLRVENVGRCRMRLNGRQANEASVGGGDVLEIGQQVSFLCVERPLRFPESRVGVGAFGKPDIDGIVGESPAIWRLRDSIAFVGGLAGHVLVRGESGVGKELVARGIHRASARQGALLSRNATTFPETLIDAELFGNAEGYPNPGMRERKGLFGAADRGTLFLDEIGDLPLSHQAHLLRVLDAGEYQRLGETTVRRTDLRLVAATNRPLSALRNDMLARFELTIDVPDLRSRREDIPLLVRRLLELMAAQDASIRSRFFDAAGEPCLSPELVPALVRNPPEANLRGLRSTLWRAIEQSSGDSIELSMDAKIDSDTASPPVGASEQEVDATRLRGALDANGGSIEKTRRALGLSSRFVLLRMMRKHGIRVQRSARDGES